MSKHTPGPWKVSFNKDSDINQDVVDRHGEHVVYGCARINASLIAAAPAMLEALQNIAKASIDIPTTGSPQDDAIMAMKKAGELIERMRQMAHLALERTSGES